MSITINELLSLTIYLYTSLTQMDDDNLEVNGIYEMTYGLYLSNSFLWVFRSSRIGH